MDRKEKIKEKLLEHSVAAVLAVIVLLLSVIWLAVPSAVWGTASAVIPKRVLWALLGLESIAIALLAAYILDNRRKLKKMPPHANEPQYFKLYGVMWDSDADPRCPVCLTLMHSADRFILNGIWYEKLRCPKCKAGIFLKDDISHPVVLDEAKEHVTRMMPLRLRAARRLKELS